MPRDRSALYRDVTEGESALAAGRPLELTSEQVARRSARSSHGSTGLPRRPDLVVVHQHALAHALLDAVEPDDPALTILTGHDHEHPRRKTRNMRSAVGRR